jgi:hypothetical protein
MKINNTYRKCPSWRDNRRKITDFPFSKIRPQCVQKTYTIEYCRKTANIKRMFLLQRQSQEY